MWAELCWQSRTAKMSAPASCCSCVAAHTLGRLIQLSHQQKTVLFFFFFFGLLNWESGKKRESSEKRMFLVLGVSGWLGELSPLFCSHGKELGYFSVNSLPSVRRSKKGKGYVSSREALL